MPRFQYAMFLAFFTQIILTAILDNCLRYNNSAVNNKPICLECRDGFYLNADSCLSCFGLNVSMLCLQPLSKNQQPTNKPNISSNAQSKNQSLNNSAGNISGSSIVLSDSKGQTYNVSLKLQNCKQADILGLCNICFPHYKLNIQKICVKDQLSNLQNCLVFSQITNVCLMCDDTYTPTQKGDCVKGSEGESSTNNLTAFVIALNTTQIQIDKVNELTQASVKNSQEKQGKSQYYRNKIDQVKDNATISLKQLADVRPSKGSVNDELQKSKSINIVFLKNQSNGLTIMQMKNKEEGNGSQDCVQYNENICKRCKNGLFFNFLQNKCQALNKPIQFKSTSINQTKIVNQTFHINDSNKLSNLTQNPTNLIVLSNITSTPKTNTSTGNNPNITNTIVNKQNNTLSNPTFKNATNKTLLNNSNTVNISKPDLVSSTKNLNLSNDTGLTNIKNNTQPSNNSNLPINVTNQANSTNSSIIVTSTNKTVQNNTKLSITTKIDPISNLTIKIIGTTTNPPKKLPFCIKYRELTYECVLCQQEYNLYNGNCYDDYDFRQLTKNKKIFYNQVGI